MGKIGKSLLKFLKPVLCAYVGFTIAVPVVLSKVEEFYIPPSFSEVRQAFDLNLEKLDIPKEYTITDYVKLSHYIVASKLKHKPLDAFDEIFPNTDYSLSKGIGRCREYSYLTYIVFQELVKQNNREELLDDVVIASGFRDDPEGLGSHMWIRYLQNKKWNDYDVIVDIFREKDLEISNFERRIRELSPTFVYTDNNGNLAEEYHLVSEIRIINKEVESDLTLAGILEAPIMAPRIVYFEE